MSCPVIDLNPLAPEPQLSERVRPKGSAKRRIGNDHDNKWNRAGDANAKTGTEMPQDRSNELSAPCGAKSPAVSRSTRVPQR
jgi:hypothetical protein